MIPMRTSSVFKSRWMALIWAAGILWAAYDFVGSEPQSTNASSNAADGSASMGDQNKVADILGN